MAVCYCFFVLVVFTFIVDSDNLAVLFVYLLIVPVFIWSLGEFGCFDIFMFFNIFGVRGIWLFVVLRFFSFILSSDNLADLLSLWITATDSSRLLLFDARKTKVQLRGRICFAAGFNDFPGYGFLLYLSFSVAVRTILLFLTQRDI